MSYFFDLSKGKNHFRRLVVDTGDFGCPTLCWRINIVNFVHFLECKLTNDSLKPPFSTGTCGRELDSLNGQTFY